ncbi:hypothetical protein AVP_14 [Aerococcus phage vB_AviM_AVP]|nr:hypothetical protein AVP_14 [Aerococcus phage vB_AviM_AVP]
MKFYYQSELNNLTDETIKAIEDYTEDNFTNKFFYKVSREFDDQRDDEDRIFYLENLAIDLELDRFNLTDVQAIIVAYMFVNDLFGRAYVYDIMKMLENML